MSNNSSNIAVALIAGAAVGAVLGLLFAPDKGSETRKKIKDKFNKEKEDLESKYDDFIESIKSKISGTEHKFDESLDKLVTEGLNKTEDVIGVLESKLAALKKEVSKK
jgi:gas vesicle protein